MHSCCCCCCCFIMETLQAVASLQGIQVNHKLLPKWMYRRKRAEIARKLIPQSVPLVVWQDAPTDHCSDLEALRSAGLWNLWSPTLFPVARARESGASGIALFMQALRSVMACAYVLHPMYHGTCSFCQRLPAGSFRYLIALIDPAGVFPESLGGNRMRNRFF